MHSFGNFGCYGTSTTVTEELSGQFINKILLIQSTIQKEAILSVDESRSRGGHVCLQQPTGPGIRPGAE